MTTSGVCPWSIGDDDFLLVTEHGLLRDVARDWSHFTSAVPLRVPIPPDTGGRIVAQLPLESDPPDTMDYRRIVAEPFSRTAAARAEPFVASMAEVLLTRALDAGRLEVTDSFALPIFLRALANVLGQPQDDATEWIAWGRTVWEWSAEARRYLPNERMDRYIESRVDEAMAAPGDDYFGTLVRAQFRDRPLNRSEILGLVNLTLAGGRDTTVAVIANGLYHLANHPSDFRYLAADPTRVPIAAEEFLRVFAPIRVLGRVATEPTELAGHSVHSGDLIGLGYAIASRDPSHFDRPDDCRLDRRPNRHLAFGHGPHTCLGAPLARMVINTVLRVIVTRLTSIAPLGQDAPRSVEIAPGTHVPWAPSDVVLQVE